MLATYDRQKKREEVSREDALCKALGWFFPLMAKFKIASIEELVYRKYPYACPYCRKMPHNDPICKTVRGAKSTVDHEALGKEYSKNKHKRPKSLTDWVRMFQDIYPRAVHDSKARSTLGLFEELGELAEAIRVFDRYPKYLVGEAADVFSYLMGLANEHSLRVAMDEDREFQFEAEFMKRYPGLCTQCGDEICKCPSIPEATVGRLAKELGVEADDPVFLLDFDALHKRGSEISKEVLGRLGPPIHSDVRFPFDRGEANEALVLFCSKMATVTDDTELASRLSAAAVKLGTAVTYPGSKQKPEDVTEVLEELQNMWLKLAPVAQKALDEGGDDLASRVGKMLQRIRVLLVIANPRDTERLEVDTEARAISEAIRQSKFRDFIAVTPLFAATTDDLRRALLEGEYDVLHFSGHGDPVGPVFSDLAGEASTAPLEALAALVARYPTIKCVVLNACWSLSDCDAPLAHYTIGMSAEVGDRAAIEFARGFYDGLGAGRDFAFAIDEGKSAVDLKGLGRDLPIVVLQKERK
jgi:NTP pyrophosphatase (non-canonical NTP hydrolase)